ncbi:uncharacterized protein LOC133172649 [Saccostrea echinata]|uniref:uncharacterized protein LOC133172649 n=1 Tax=Saccostrea echinata TaxID=191078 RepID=UPI002A7F0012|nr:uncharacterized protein LOC133172649 [Saccostrea echinata]
MIIKFQAKKATPRSPLCASHDREPCHMFCEECNTPMCLKCIASNTHIGHKLSILKDVFYSRMETVQRDKDELEQTISPTYYDIATSIEQRITEAEEDYEKLITMITQHEEKWIKTIKEYIGNMKTEVIEMKSKHLEALEIHLVEINQRRAEVNETLKSCHKISKSNEMMEYLNYRSRKEEFQNIPAKVNVLSPEFKPKHLEEEMFGELFGAVTKMSISSEENGYTMKTVDEILETKSSRFTDWLDKPEIEAKIFTGHRCLGIACVNEEEIWTRGDIRGLVRLYNTNNSSHIKDIEMNSSVDSIAVTRSGNLVCADKFEGTIKIVRNNEIEELIKYQCGWKPLSVYCTCTDDILVVESGFYRPKKKSVKDIHYFAPKAETSVRVTRYSGSKETQSIQYDDDENPLFPQDINFPHICENNNMDICVCYSFSRYNLEDGAVVVISQNGKLKFRYTGHNPSPKDKSFMPGGLATNSQSYIFVADNGNNCIHIISEDGQFLHFIDFNHLFITEHPRDLCLDNNDNMYVAFDSNYHFREVQKVKYRRCNSINSSKC